MLLLNYLSMDVANPLYGTIWGKFNNRAKNLK